MDIYFMRHGETDWNTVKRLQGKTDIPLNQNGIALAEKVFGAVKKSGISFDLIFSSPLVRAQKTAQIMSDGAKIIIDERISEFCFGEAEGITLEKIRSGADFEQIKNWFAAPEKYKAEKGAESFEHFFARIDSFLEDLRKIERENAQKSILAVCHGGVVRGLVLRMQNLPISKFAQTKIPNCAMNKAVLQNGIFKMEYIAKEFATL